MLERVAKNLDYYHALNLAILSGTHIAVFSFLIIG